MALRLSERTAGTGSQEAGAFPDEHIRVVVIDDHDLVREGLVRLLRATPDVEVVGEAASCAQALRRVPVLEPDVAIVDVHLPDGDGVLLCRELREVVPRLKCVILTAHEDEGTVLDAVVAGASAYLLKQARPAQLVNAVHVAAGGGSLMDPAAVMRVRKQIGGDAEWDPKLSRLTTQERRALHLIALGRTNREIGSELGITEKTVKNYVTTILAKVGLRHRTEAALWMRRRVELQAARGDRAWVAEALRSWPGGTGASGSAASGSGG